MSKYGPLSRFLLNAIGEATGFFSWPSEGSREWVWKELHNHKRVYRSLKSMESTGLVKKISKDSKIFFELTAKGELDLLLLKAAIEVPKVWDFRWRLLIFDIPEDCRDKRDELRLLLKNKGFKKLQQSVFIHPYPLNKEAVSYLKQTGLIKYIRIITAYEIDDDTDLRKKFKLPTGN